MSKVLHILDHSLPEQSGYASRSHAILTSLAQHGVDIEAITSSKQTPSESRCDTIDGIRYWRAAAPGTTAGSGIAGQLQVIRETRRAVREHIQTHGADVLHAHSPCLNGLAVWRMGLPYVYEMRSSWEDAAVSNGTTSEGSMRYRVSKMLETFAARAADAVTVICEGLKEELLERGIAGDKITVAPNALPESMFVHANDAEITAIRSRYGIGSRPVVGFFGSFFEWEGVATLIDALPKLLVQVPDVCLLLAGGGLQEAILKEKVESLSLSKHVIFAGRVLPEEMPAFYGVADLMVFPRISMRLTNMVTPLKPLEAMAHSVPVLASDVGGHKELIADGKTGFLYPAGDQQALVKKMAEMLNAPNHLQEVAEAGLAWVRRERRWSVVAERYLPVYERLANSGRS